MKTLLHPLKWSFTATILLFSSPHVCEAQSLNWEVTEQWNSTWEDRYSKFIEAIGQSKQTSLVKCINSPLNPYRIKTPPGLFANLDVDCADLPYVLRAYFAFINKLPFSYTQEVGRIGEGTDIRYSPNGNKPVKPPRKISGPDKPNVRKVLTDIISQISSAQYRTSPKFDPAEANPPDFYSPAINRKSIRPGTIVYDPNGHVAIIYEVEKNGVIHLMDAHPDNTISHIVYGKKFVRSRPEVGAGFKNWRPHTSAAPPDYSLVQYLGTKQGVKDWKQASFSINGQPRDYYEYVRESMADGALEYEPLSEFGAMLEYINADLLDRANAVEVAIAKHIDQRPHPARLPSNIYGTEGDWETYASPSRDARLKAGFLETQEKVEKFLQMADEHDKRLKFQGSREELMQQLQQLYLAHAAKPAVHYQSSQSDEINVQLTFAQIEDRLFKLSFDPYHCIELRWGAENRGTHDPSEKDWYRAEQRLRNQVDRLYGVVMNFTLDDLKAKKDGSGQDTPPTYRLREILGVSSK